MKNHEMLRQAVRQIDGRGYKSYKSIEGTYAFPRFLLAIDHVQGDPFAAPSRLRAIITLEEAGFPPDLLSTKTRRVAAADFTARQFANHIPKICRLLRGTGKSGAISIDSGGQEVLERTCACFTATDLEVRFVLGLPATGRRVLGRQALEMLTEEVPQLVETALLCRNLSVGDLRAHVEVVEDQRALRDQLADRGLVCFVGNGSILPRLSGIDDRPLLSSPEGPVVPFTSPPELEVELQTPNAGPVRGMGIPAGVTLIVGGGYHGKSTLLRALERGVYDHIPGDGRDKVVTIPSAVKIRAEDGRFVEKVNISPFINNLPYGRDTTRFSTLNASGSTSQAANIIEAMEVGTELLLIDEDTSATNFIIRDARMQALVKKEKEPITPFLDRVHQIYDDHNTSTILVMGGSGDYFDVADQVIMMDSYVPHCVTGQARDLVSAIPTKRQAEAPEPFSPVAPRMPLAQSFDASRGRRSTKVDSKGLSVILFGTQTIDLSGIEQLVDTSQTRAIGEAILYFARKCAIKGMSLSQGLEFLDAQLDREGLDLLLPYKVGNLARPRPQEVAFAINRLRSLLIR